MFSAKLCLCTTMASEERHFIPTFLLIIIMSSFLSAALEDTLNQGDVLNSSQYLVSAKRKFTLGFFNPPYDLSKNYLGIWYTNFRGNRSVWIANRDGPISNGSGLFLTLDHLGKLMINPTGFEGDPFVIYSGGGETQNTSIVTLLDTGNLVVREVNSDGSIGSSLWESFDHPTDTLLPGMKLGVNHITGSNWSLTSWLTQDDPASGPFTLEWEAKTSQLVIKRRGVPYWSTRLIQANWLSSSGHTVFYLEYLEFNRGHKYIINNFTDVDGNYFMYSADAKEELYLDPEERGKWSWRLDCMGQMFEWDIAMMKMDFCYGYGKEKEGCEEWAQPNCRSYNQTFGFMSGFFKNMGPDRLQDNDEVGVFDNSTAIGPADCRALCWNNCDCLGYDGDGQTRCQYWAGNLTFILDDGVSRIALKYVLSKEDPSNKG